MDSLILRERYSDSPYIDKVLHGLTLADEAVIRPAASHWHMVFSKRQGRMYPLAVGPLTTSGLASWTKDAEVLWIKFKLGAYMPHLPTVKLLDTTLGLPEASSQSFWLKSSAWEFPTYENADTFIERLVRAGLLVCDPVVNAALAGPLPAVPFRTLRHRFLHVTGQSRNRIRQLERVQQAQTLLQQGHSILDVVSQAGYADQPHLTRALKQLVGYTPAQVLRTSL